MSSEPFEPDPPLGVRLVYIDGSMRTLSALFYVGINADGLHEWETVNPDPGLPITELQVDVLPAHTTVTVRR